MENKIIKILEDSQKGCVNHMRNVKALEQVYNSSDFQPFLEFFLCKTQAVIAEDYENPAVQSTLEFLAKFVAHIASVQSEDETQTHPFLMAVLPEVIKFHQYPGDAHKHNMCMFISLMLQHLGTETVLSGEVIDMIQNALLENVKDSKASIRLQALIALTRLQDPCSQDCPVIRAFTRCLYDTSHLVRREAVKLIAPNTYTIPKLKDKTRDKVASVRNAALIHIADIGMKHFRIVYRHFILRSGFTETNSQVKKTFLEYLLPKWLTSLNGCYLSFLNCIKLDADEADILTTEELCNQIMEAFFRTESVKCLIEALGLDENRVIPENKIKSESAHYWNLIVKRLRQLDELEEYLENALPELTLFCNYIEKITNNKFSRSLDDYEFLDVQNLLYHLFDIAENYDLTEEVGRKTLDALIKKLLRKHRLQPRLLNKLITIDRKLATNVESFITDICMIISDIWQPLTDAVENFHEKEFKISELTVKLNILVGDQEDAVSNEDFKKAQIITVQIRDVTEQLNQLKAQSVPTERVNSKDPETMYWCLDLLAALLVHSNISSLTPSLITCREEFLMPLMISNNPEIEWRAFKCFTVYCYYDRKLAEDSIKLLCRPIAAYRLTANINNTVLMDSIAIITDLIRLQGTELFRAEDDVNANNTSNMPVNKRRLYSEDLENTNSLNDHLSVDCVVSTFLSMLDDEDDEIRDAAVTAIAKLILNDFPANSMVMTRLILKWYNPGTRIREEASNIKDKRRIVAHEKNLQQKLGVIIKAYTERVANAREIVAQSVVPVLTKVAEAPAGSPLLEIDGDNVIKFLAVITDSASPNGLLHVHIDLARTILYEISVRPTQTVTMYFAKMLNALNIPADGSLATKELIASAESILEKESLDKCSLQNVKKFVSKLNNNSVTNTTAATDHTANTTATNDSRNNESSVNQTTSTANRRLSAIIEEDNSGESNGKSTPVEKRGDVGIENESNDEEIPRKKARVDEQNRQHKTRRTHLNGQMPSQPVDMEREQVTTSDSDVVVSSQPDTVEQIKSTNVVATLPNAASQVRGRRRPKKKSISPANNRSEKNIQQSFQSSAVDTKGEQVTTSDSDVVISSQPDTVEQINNTNVDTLPKAPSQVRGRGRPKKTSISPSSDRSEKNIRRSPRTIDAKKNADVCNGKLPGSSKDKKSSDSSVIAAPANDKNTGKGNAGNKAFSSSDSATGESTTSGSSGTSQEEGSKKIGRKRLRHQVKQNERDLRKQGRDDVPSQPNEALSSGSSGKSPSSTGSSSRRWKDDSCDTPDSRRLTRNNSNKQENIDGKSQLQKENSKLQNKNRGNATDESSDSSQNSRRSTRKNGLRESNQLNNVKTPATERRNEIVLPPKSVQVKRRKYRGKKNDRISISHLDESTYETSLEQTLHTIVDPSEFHQELLTDDEVESSSVSHHFQVLISETSSDESPAKSIRTSSRKSRRRVM